MTTEECKETLSSNDGYRFPNVINMDLFKYIKQDSKYVRLFNNSMELNPTLLINYTV